MERVFGQDFYFRAGYNEISFTRSFLDLPFQQRVSDDLLHQKDRIMQQSEKNLVRSVRKTIADLILQQNPTLEMTAKVHNRHKRTLECRLNRWGTAFEVLLDQFRRERGLEFVQQGRRTITDIAFLLGYSDPSHFIRAFRRWTGMALKEFASGASLVFPLRLPSVGSSLVDCYPIDDRVGSLGADKPDADATDSIGPTLALGSTVLCC